MKSIPVSGPLFSGNEIKYVTDCITTSWVSTGKYITKFEKKFARFCNSSYALTTSSGTSSLHLTLLALGIKPGDEVMIPDLTYVSTANAIKYVGATPVFVEVDKDIWSIDPEELEKKITKRTKAIIVVHLYGHPADMDRINSIAKEHKLVVIEDVCQAHGAEYKTKKVGSLSKAGCFSFSGAKIITTGEGGMITSDDNNLIEVCTAMRRNFASKNNNFFHTDIGYNYRLTNIQAALGLAQLERINSLIRVKIRNAMLYDSILKDVVSVQLPTEKSWAKNIYWLYSIVLKKPGLRDKLVEYLSTKGIETRRFFVPMHKLPVYKQKVRFPVTEFLSENGLSLPSGLALTSTDIEFVSSHVKKFLKKHA
ncbi:MAG: DegT/DnrJ/EryC1/StrS family aminotransferase [Candidatus Levybacteria bacterium]|nr:DegT/DnrJ/EryC1/StrS family aminotransferase [Candidatus Levybacteria bacterium]